MFNSLSKGTGLIGLLVAFCLTSTGCPNNSGTEAPVKGSGSTSGGKSFFGGSSGGDLPSAGTENFITIDNVVRSNVDPNSMIDIIGSNSEIGTQCPTANDCSCAFRWTESNGIVREAEQTPTYVETNLMRCLFTVVTSDVTKFDVKIKIKAANLFSNEFRVTISAPNPSFDSSIAANFLPVHRYMCRDIMGKAQNTNWYRNDTLVDPRLWGSTFSLAFNFYTTSFGADYGATQDSDGNTVPGYECPIVPNDISDQSIYNLTLKSKAPINLSDPSQINVAVGDDTIFPPDDDLNKDASRCPTGEEAQCEKFFINRSDFYVAQFRSGIFKEPLCILHKVSNVGGNGGSPQPLDCTVDLSSGLPQVGSSSVGKDVIGFAAVPDANQKCPDINAVKIPAGKKWAKVWQFRISFQKRTIPDVANSGDIGQLFCTNREDECRGSAILDGSAADGDPRYVNSVCYSALNASSGPKMGVQQSAQTGPSLSSPGFGNCNELGNVGDGNGNRTDGNYDGYETGNPQTNAQSCIGTNLPDGSGDGNGAAAANCCKDDLGARTAVQALNLRPANFTPGGQWCNPGLIGRNNATAQNAVGGGNTLTPVGGLAKDIWLMGNGNRRACVEADTDENGALAGVFQSSFPPAEVSNPFIETPKELDTNPRFDIVYVVTPESVKFEDMQDSENNPIAKQYTPFRLAADGTPLSYFLFSESLNTNDPNQRTSKFPLCVLQDAKKGANGTLNGAAL